jgi:hypothetical protein
MKLLVWVKREDAIISFLALTCTKIINSYSNDS